MARKIKIAEDDLHPHIQARMLQRGISKEEMEITLNRGWDAEDVIEGTFGKVCVFSYKAEWEGKFYNEREITVYYKYRGKEFILLTAKSRYGDQFPRKEKK